MAQEDLGKVRRIEQELELIDESKRQTLRRLIGGTAFVVPVVTSFAIDSMAVGPALALPSNQS